MGQFARITRGSVRQFHSPLKPTESLSGPPLRWNFGVPERRFHDVKCWLATILALLAGAIAVAQTGRSTKPAECSELKLGQSKHLRSETISNSTARAYAAIAITRPSSDTEGKACRVEYQLFVARGQHPFVAVKTFTDTTDTLVGAEVVGFSRDESKLAADFWWAAGDYTGHRPVIYDLNTNRTQFGELGEQLTAQLPSCDYFEEFTGVTDPGEAIIHVPKSAYVDEGCPDQGDWLFNLRKKTVRRRSDNEP